MSRRHFTMRGQISRWVWTPAALVVAMAIASQAVNAGDKGDMSHGEHFAPLSEVMGMSVVDSAGEQVGEVENAIVDQATGQIDYLVINHDKGALDLVGTSYAIPFSAFTSSQQVSESSDSSASFSDSTYTAPNTPEAAADSQAAAAQEQADAQMSQDQDRQAVLSIDRTVAELEMLPEFDADQWGEIDRETWADSIDQAWNSVTGEIPQRDESDTADDTDSEQAGDSPRQYVLGTDLDDVQIVLADDTEAGLDQVIVDCGQGAIAYLSVNDDQGDARLVKFDQVQSLDAERAVLSIGQSELRAAQATPENINELGMFDTSKLPASEDDAQQWQDNAEQDAQTDESPDVPRPSSDQTGY